MSWQAKTARMAASVARRLGNAVAIGSTSAFGFLESPEEKVYDGTIVLTDYMLELPVLSWQYVAEGTIITVDGVVYRAREQGRPNPDGSSIMVPLELIGADEPLTVIINGDFL